MATLHQDTDITRKFQKQIEEVVQALEKNISQLGDIANSVVKEAWIGNSATSFLSDFNAWQARAHQLTRDLDTLSGKLSNEILDWEQAAAALSVNPPPSGDHYELREWWHNILRTHGKYSTYMVFLILPSDVQLAIYLSRYGREIDLLSGTNCLVIVFRESDFLHMDFNDKSWICSTHEHISKGYSLIMADMFGVTYAQFPCVLVFQDIRSPEHVTISLKNLSKEEVAERMRLIYSVIKQANASNQNPLQALKNQEQVESFRKTSQSLIEGAKELGGKTLESAMQALIKNLIG